MREILFRGKRKDFDNEWLYGFYTLYNNNRGMKPTIIAGAEENCCILLEVIPETVGQYTGLTDKNGKKIFEGDIVTCQTKYGADVGQVIFAMGKFCVWWHSEYNYPRNAKMIMCYDINSKTKIIGNIHDNPELLRGEE